MKRRNFLHTSSLALGLFALNKKDLLASLHQEQGYHFKPLRNNVGIFNEQGGTIGWLNSTIGYVVVDAQFPTTAPHLITELKKMDSKPFLNVFNTHHHSDHTAGNISFKGMIENVIAHENSLMHQMEVAKKQGNENDQLYPDVVFSDEFALVTPDETMMVYYNGPGHTDGDSIIHFENANIVHMGDLVFNRRFPFIDRTAGANIQNWILLLEDVIRNFDKDTLFIFGHSLDPEKTTGTASDVKAFQHYLSSLLDLVSSKIKANQPLEEILKIQSIPGAEEWKGDGIERSLRAAYEELTYINTENSITI